MGDFGNWIPWLLLGGVLIGGFLLLRGVGQAFMDPNVQKTIHAVTSQQFQQIINDKVSGKITQAEADAKLKALSDATVNFARSVH